MDIDRLVLRVIFCLCVSGMTTSLEAADWTQWGGTNNRNMVSQEKGLADSFEPTKTAGSGESADRRNVKWTVRTGAFTYGNPTVCNGRVFVGTDAQTLSADSRFGFTKGGLLKCLLEETGEVLWQMPVPARGNLRPGTHFGHQHLGICSSPTVDNGHVYIVSSSADILCLDVHGQADGNDGPFKDEAQYMVDKGKEPVQLNTKDGDIVWRYDPLEELGVYPHDAASCSVLIIGDMLYTGTSNGVDGPHEKMLAPLAPSLIVLDKRTGKLLATDAEKIGTRMYHCQWASPSSGEVNGRTQVFFGGGDGICYAFEALKDTPDEVVSLKKIWSYDCNPHDYKFENGKEIPYYRGDKRKSYSTNKNDGKYVGPCQIIATPVFCNGRVYIAIGQDPAHGRGRGMLHCIDASGVGDITESGRIWTYDGIERSMATVAVADGLVYANDVSGKLHCLDADTGECYWVHDTGRETWGGPLVADGRLYFGNNASFYIMAHGKEPRVICEQRVSSPICSTTVAANGVLYVASNRFLWAIAE